MPLPLHCTPIIFVLDHVPKGLSPRCLNPVYTVLVWRLTFSPQVNCCLKGPFLAVSPSKTDVYLVPGIIVLLCNKHSLTRSLHSTCLMNNHVFKKCINKHMSIKYILFMTGCVGKRLEFNNLQPSQCSTCFYWCFFLPEPPVCVVQHGFTYSHLQVIVIVAPVSVETWQRWNRILTCRLRTGDLLKVSSGCLECSASVSFHHGNSSETQPDILPVHQ